MSIIQETMVAIAKEISGEEVGYLRDRLEEQIDSLREKVEQSNEQITRHLTTSSGKIDSLSEWMQWVENTIAEMKLPWYLKLWNWVRRKK